MSEVLFKLISFIKNGFAWTRVPAYPCFVKQLAKPGRLFIYVLIFTAHNLIEVKRRHLNDIEPDCGRVDHSHAGQTNIIPNDSATCMMLYCRLAI